MAKKKYIPYFVAVGCKLNANGNKIRTVEKLEKAWLKAADSDEKVPMPTKTFTEEELVAANKEGLKTGVMYFEDTPEPVATEAEEATKEEEFTGDEPIELIQ